MASTDPDAARPIAAAESAIGATALLSAARLVVNTGFRFVYPFLPAIARGLGISLQQSGFLVSARWIAGLATPAVVVTVGRRRRRRRLIVVGLLAFAAGALITAGTGVFLGALVGFAAMGLGKPSFDVSGQAYISDRVPYARRARYLAVFETTWALALLVGAPLAGWLIQQAGWEAPFVLVGALALVGAIATRLLLEPGGDREGARASRIDLDAAAVALLVVVGLFTFAAESMFIVFGAWLEDSFALSLTALGGAALVIGLSELTGEVGTGLFTDRLGKRRAVALGLSVSIVGFVLAVPAADSLGPGMAALALALLGFEFTIVSSIPLASEVRPRARARYLALFVVAAGVARAIAAATGPLLFTSYGLAGNALAAAAADVVALVILLTMVADDRGYRVSVAETGGER